MRGCTILIILLISLSGFSQSLDELHSRLSSSTSDTATLNVLNELTYYHVYEDNDSADYYNKKSFGFAKNKNIIQHNFDGYYWKAQLLKWNKQYDKAHFTAMEGETIARAMNDIHNIAISKLLIGTIFESQGKTREPIEKYLEGLLISETANDKDGILQAKEYLGLYFKSQNESTKALQYFLEAINLAEELKDSNSLFMCSINLGSLYEYTRDPEKALKFYQKALLINEGDNDPNGRAICVFKIGRVYLRLNKTDSARIFLNETMEIHKSRNDELGLILDYAFLGSSYNKEGNYEKSDEAYDMALELALKHGDSLKIVRIYTYIGRAEMTRGHYQNALKNFEHSLNIAPSNFAVSAFGSNYGQISECYAQLGQFKKAHNYHKLFKLFSDSAFNSNDTKRQTELKLGYEFDQIQKKLLADSEAKDLQNKAEMERQQQQRNYLLLGLMLISIMLFLAFRSYRMKKKANEKLKEQKDEIEHQKLLVDQKNREISDSINYALQIQKASLPETKKLKRYFPTHSLFYRPKDIVSGDFYWAAGNDEFSLIAIADCTGHGVPGAITSMIGSMLLNEIHYVKKMTQPNEMLTELNRLVKLTLRQESDSLSSDGMDIAICQWNKKSNKLLYSGAHRVMYILRGEELLIHKPTKDSIGGAGPLIQNFNLVEVQLEKDDTIILTSDGYVDQFGGIKDKKFTSKVFRNMLMDNANLTFEKQSNLLASRFDEWKGDNEQTDDVIVFMMKV